MFADSLLETSWAQPSRRGWTTLTSFGLEAVVIGLLLLLPLWKTVGLPSARTVSTLIKAGRPQREPAARPRRGGARVASESSVTPRFVAPGHVPTTIPTGPDVPTPQPPGGGGDGIQAVGLSGTPNGLPISLFNGTRPVVLPAPPAAMIRAYRPSNLLEGSLIRRVEPVYPPLARSARIQGAVVLFAIISKAGTIGQVRVVSGHPLLVPAAIDAVSQWRYRPYILNSEPIEVETQITVNFILAGY